MEVAVTWDLLITMFFIVIMSYSYIVGRNGTVKIILSTYIAMLAANGLGNLLAKYIILSKPLIKVLTTNPDENVVIFKIFVFIVLLLALVLRGGFNVDIGYEESALNRIVSNTVFGFLSAGLIISTLFVYMADSGNTGVLIINIQESLNIPASTWLVKTLINYYNFWFTAPAAAFILASLMGPEPAPLIED